MKIFIDNHEYAYPQLQFRLSDFLGGFSITVSNFGVDVISRGKSYDVRVELFPRTVSDLQFQCHEKSNGFPQLLVGVPSKLRVQEKDGPEWKVVNKQGRIGLRCEYLEHYLYLVDYQLDAFQVCLGDKVLEAFEPQPLPTLMWEARRVLRENLSHWGKLADAASNTSKSEVPHRFARVG